MAAGGLSGRGPAGSSDARRHHPPSSPTSGRRQLRGGGEPPVQPAHGATLVDITHQVSPGDVRAGSISCRGCAPFPRARSPRRRGPASARRARALAAEGDVILRGAGQRLADSLPGPRGFVELPTPPGRFTTFHARDVFARPPPSCDRDGADARGRSLTDPYRSPLPIPRMTGSRWSESDLPGSVRLARVEHSGEQVAPGGLRIKVAGRRWARSAGPPLRRCEPVSCCLRPSLA